MPNDVEVLIGTVGELEDDPTVTIQARALQAKLDRTYTKDQKFCTLKELSYIADRIIAYDAKPRDLGNANRAACHCCGSMFQHVFDAIGLHFCVPCVQKAFPMKPRTVPEGKE